MMNGLTRTPISGLGSLLGRSTSGGSSSGNAALELIIFAPLMLLIICASIDLGLTNRARSLLRDSVRRELALDFVVQTDATSEEKRNERLHAAMKRLRDGLISSTQLETESFQLSACWLRLQFNPDTGRYEGWQLEPLFVVGAAGSPVRSTGDIKLSRFIAEELAPGIESVPSPFTRAFTVSDAQGNLRSRYASEQYQIFAQIQSRLSPKKTFGGATLFRVENNVSERILIAPRM